VNVTLVMTKAQKEYIREELFSRGGEPAIDAFIELLDRQGLTITMTSQEAVFLKEDIENMMIQNLLFGGGNGDISDQAHLRMLRKVVANIQTAIMLAAKPLPPIQNPDPFDVAFKAFPACIVGGLDRPKTVSDLVYQALHELDMFEEGQDGAITARQAAVVRKFVEKFRTTER
jgi:hypothetical protein